MLIGPEYRNKNPARQFYQVLIKSAGPDGTYKALIKQWSNPDQDLRTIVEN